MITENQKKVLRNRNITFTTFKLVISALFTKPISIREEEFMNHYEDFASSLEEHEISIEDFAKDYYQDWTIIKHGSQLKSVSLKAFINKEWWLTEKQKPEPGREVLGFHEEWINEDFNPDGIRVCFMLDDQDDQGNNIWKSVGWCNYHDEWHTMSTDNINPEGVMTGPKENVIPSHWKFKPMNPKELFNKVLR